MTDSLFSNFLILLALVTTKLFLSSHALTKSYFITFSLLSIALVMLRDVAYSIVVAIVAVVISYHLALRRFRIASLALVLLLPVQVITTAYAQ